MSLPTADELERRYGAMFSNDAIQQVVHARTPNDAAPVDENAILRFVKDSEDNHAAYVRAALTVIF